MSYQFYTVLHLVGVLFLFTSLGALAATASSTRAPLRRIATIAHGVALAVILVAGFGLLARLGFFGDIPIWAWTKMGLWLILGVVVFPLKRRPEWAPVLWLVIPVLGGIAAWLAVVKPF